jgi:hypothetical protein
VVDDRTVVGFGKSRGAVRHQSCSSQHVACHVVYHAASNTERSAERHTQSIRTQCSVHNLEDSKRRFLLV